MTLRCLTHLTSGLLSAERYNILLSEMRELYRRLAFFHDHTIGGSIMFRIRMLDGSAARETGEQERF